MEITYGKLEKNKIYSNTFFALIPRFASGKVWWLTRVHKEISVDKDGVSKTKLSKGYDGVIFFTDKEVVFNQFIIFNRFKLRLSF